MAKLHGLTMGLDVCATFHMGIAPDALQEATRRIVELAAPAYLMARRRQRGPDARLSDDVVPRASTTPAARRDATSRRPCSRRLAALGACGRTERSASEHRRAGNRVALRIYMKEGGDRRTIDALRAGRPRRRSSGFARADTTSGTDTMPTTRRRRRCAARIEAIYAHARQALYARLDTGVVRGGVAASRSRPDAHRAIARITSRIHRSGESIRDEDAARIVSLIAARAAGRRRCRS